MELTTRYGHSREHRQKEKVIVVRMRKVFIKNVWLFSFVRIKLDILFDVFREKCERIKIASAQYYCVNL